MILYGDDTTARCLGTAHQQLLVDGLESKGVNDANVDVLGLQLVIGFDGLVESDTYPDHGHLVIVGALYQLQRRKKKTQSEGKVGGDDYMLPWKLDMPTFPLPTAKTSSFL